MAVTLREYFRSLKRDSRLDPSVEDEAFRELEDHASDRMEELRKAGLSDEEAERTCLNWLGSARLVARRLYEAHSRGTWQETVLATTPHILFALTFALNWWQGTLWLIALLLLTIATAIYGWWRGKPVWLFPWLGYSMLPVIAGGLLLLYLPRGWAWVAVAVYVPFALWLFVSVAMQTIRRDWLYGSLMLFPVPIVAGWLVAIQAESDVSGQAIEYINLCKPYIGLTFLILALTVAFFIYFRRRWLKVATLVLSGLLTLTLVAFQAQGRLEPWAFTILILLLLANFLTPALLERRVRDKKEAPGVLRHFSPFGRSGWHSRP